MSNRSRLFLAIAFGAFVVYGMNEPVLGTAWPFLRLDLDRPVGDLGVVIAFSVAGFASASSLAGSVSRRLGTGGALALAYALAAVGVTVLGTAQIWPQILGGALLAGAASGLLDPTMNSWLARHYGLRVMNLLHTSFGFGATVGPLVAVGVIRIGSWRWMYAGLAIWALVMLGVVLATRRGWGGPVRQVATDGVPARRTGVAVLLAAFMVTTGTEIGVGQWAFSVLRDGRGLADGPAAAFTSAFWGGLAAVRLLGVFTGERRPKRVILAWSSSGLLAGLSWFALDPVGLGAIGLPVAGAGAALIFPILVTLSAERYGDEADRVIGWGFTAAAAGGVSFPWVAGQFAQRIGFGAVGPVFVVGALLVVILTRALVPAGEGASVRVAGST